MYRREGIASLYVAVNAAGRNPTRQPLYVHTASRVRCRVVLVLVALAPLNRAWSLERALQIVQAKKR